MDCPTCDVVDCAKPATCYGHYKEDDTGGPTYSCDEHCSHGNEDGWCEPVNVIPEESDAEPGPGKGDLVCACGCGGAALYRCYTSDEPMVLACARSMKDLAEDARLFGEKFKASPFPKPLDYSIADYVRSMA